MNRELFLSLTLRRPAALGGILLTVLLGLSVVGQPPPPPDETSSARDRERLSYASALAAVPRPEISAESYLVRLADDPTPLMEYNADERVAPASLTKLMTVLVAREILAPADRVAFSPEAKAAEPAVSDVAASEVFLRDDAVRMALMASDNDAALALAEAAGKKLGGLDFADRIARFVLLMNARAAELDMKSTHFENPTGLDAPGHVSSARDIARLASYAAAADQGVLEITRADETPVFSSEGKRHILTNTNVLLDEFPGLTGGKTGMTDSAKGTLALLYPLRTGRAAVIVLLRSDDRFGDGRAILRRLDAAFE